MKKFFVNIFTYKEDEEIVKYSALSAKYVLGDDVEVNVIDDNKHPISEEKIKELNELGILYRQSTFDRKHNLNGKECVVGILEEIKKSTKGRDGVSIKLDSDTMIAHREIFDKFYDTESCMFAASHRPGSIFSGICYLIKNDILDKMIKMANDCDIHETSAPEDMTIGCLATICSMPNSIYIMPEWNPNKKEDDGLCTAWNYDCDLKYIEEYYKLFFIVTFGNWFTVKGNTKACRNKPMELFLNQILNI